MGCNYSRSEDLPRLALLKSDELFQSINEPPEYFCTSVQTSADFVKTETQKDPEMSYTGPPSHLEGSLDVHPFWAYHGLDFYERFTDKTASGDAPPTLLPSTSTAQELRQIEINEAITDLRQQVIGVIAEKKSIKKKGKKKKSKMKETKEEDESMDHLTPDEKLTIEFLESVIRDIDGESEVDPDRISLQSSVTSDSNWILGASKSSHNSPRNDADVSDRSLVSEYDNPVPGIMQEVVTDSEPAKAKVEREDSFLHKRVYLPDNDVLILDADCEIGANSKTAQQVDLMYFCKGSLSSLSSRSSKSSVLTNQMSVDKPTVTPQEDPITTTVSTVSMSAQSNTHVTNHNTESKFHNSCVDMELESEHPIHGGSKDCDQTDNNCKAMDIEYTLPSTSASIAVLEIPRVTQKHISGDVVESNHVPNGEVTNIDDIVIDTNDVQLNCIDNTKNDDVFEMKQSLDSAREASNAILRRGKVRAMASIYDRKVRESFGEADNAMRPIVVKRSSNENLQDIATLLMDGSNGRTQFKELYDSHVNYSTHHVDHQKPSTSEDTVSEDSVIVDSRSNDSYEPILGQIRADLEMLQLREDDDYGMQESIDSGFAN